MQLKILWIGKTKNRLLSSLCADYLERMQPMVSCEVVEIRDLSRARGLRGDRLKSAEGDEIGKHIREFGRIVLLDERGTELSSREFARWFQKEERQGTRELDFVIGVAEGIGDGLLRQA